MNHYIIIVPGWGTIHGKGTLRQAKEVVRFREKPTRGEARIVSVPAVEVDPLIEWRDLTDLLAEILEMEA